MRWCAFGLVAAALCPALSMAQDLSIKEFKLGSPLAALSKRTGMVCEPVATHPGSTACYRGLANKNELTKTIAGVPALGVYAVGFDDKLGEVQFTFKEDNYQAVRDAFATKFPALKCSRSTLKNRMGASFDNEVCTISSGGATLIIEQRDGKIDKGSVTLGSAEFAERFEKSKKQKAGQAAKKDI